MYFDLGKKKGKFQKLRSCAIWGHFYSGYNEKMRKCEVVENKIEKKTSLWSTKKMKKYNVRNLDLGLKIGK